MPSPVPDITLKDVLDHLQAMQTALRADIREVEGRVGKRIDGVEQTLMARIGGLEQRLDRMERNLTTQLDGIDRRLDEIEVEHLPRRVTALEQKVRR